MASDRKIPLPQLAAFVEADAAELRQRVERLRREMSIMEEEIQFVLDFLAARTAKKLLDGAA